MTSDQIKKLDIEYAMQTYAKYDVAIERGLGATVYSPEGKEYIDFTAVIGVNSIGYGNKKWADAIYAQALKLQHISNLYYSEPYAKLAKVLTERAGMKNVFFANAGGEANEGMIKLARKYSFDKYGKGRSTIVTLVQSFHGRTITTLAATGQDVFHNYFFPFTEGFTFVPANDIEALKDAISSNAECRMQNAEMNHAKTDPNVQSQREAQRSGFALERTNNEAERMPEPARAERSGVCEDDVCAVMIELIQGEGGVLPLDEGYVKAVAELCAAKDLLLLVDEVQTGVGRTGTLFTYQQYGIAPDVVSFAKGIAGGLPMGGIMANEKCSAVFAPGTHATTFGGNPVVAAGALETLRQLDEEALNEVTKKGEYIKNTITGWNLPIIGEIRGRGLMIGVSLNDAAPKDTAAKCIEAGLLILTAGSDALRMLPPLTISYEEIDKGLAILKNILEVERG